MATRKEVLTKAYEMDGFTAEEKEVIAKMITAVSKKGTGGVSKKVQAEREADTAQIAEVLAQGGTYTATEVANATGMTVQKATARLKAMVAAGTAFYQPAKGKTKAQFSAEPFPEAEAEAE